MTNPTIQTANKQKATGSHFTPTGLANVLARRILAEIKDTKGTLNVLDPSCGDGELLLAIANQSKDKRLNLIGIEEDKEAIKSAEDRLTKADYTDVTLIANDYLEMVQIEENVDLFNFEKESNEPVDIIIANPPYVRTQILGSEKSQALADKFNLSGRVDLYHAFLVAMTSQLKEGGLLGVITSNRYLTTNGGTVIREFLDENFEILEIMDLGDTKLFSAAVLPAIFIGRKKGNNTKGGKNNVTNFFRIYEDVDSIEDNADITKASSIFEILETTKSGIYETEDKRYKVSLGLLTVPSSYKEPWVMASYEELDWVSKIRKSARYLIEDVSKVRVGIKSNADKVFLKSNWEELLENIRPENELLKPLLSAKKHSKKWTPLEKRPTYRVLYPHYENNGEKAVIDLKDYPKASAYFESNKDLLMKRTYLTKSKTRKWYEIWVPQDPSAWKGLKVVFPDISPEPKFFIDTEGCIVDGNCYWIIPSDGFGDDMLFLILAISNTKLMTKYHEIAFQNKLYSGRRRYLTQYVEKYPIPDPESESAKKLVALAKELVYKENSPQKVSKLESEIENYTAKAFNVEVVKKL